MIEVTDVWYQKHPGAMFAYLAIDNIRNPVRHLDLEREKEALESDLRLWYEAYIRKQLYEHPVLAAYKKYFSQYKKTYHLLLQLESIVQKGKHIPQVASLVEAMFMAELKNLILTAGQDMDHLEKPFLLDISVTEDRIWMPNEKEQQLKENDMVLRDSQGPVTSMIYGIDRRTLIRPETTKVLFNMYIPPGVEKGRVLHHLDDIVKYVSIISPHADVLTREIISA